MKIGWTNKYSGEQGFVKSVNADEKDFVNTTVLSEAADYAPKAAEKYISALNEFQSQNTYNTIATPKVKENKDSVSSAPAKKNPEVIKKPKDVIKETKETTVTSPKTSKSVKAAKQGNARSSESKTKA